MNRKAILDQMKFVEYIWLAVLLAIVALYVINYQNLSKEEHVTLLVALALAAFMYAFRRKQRIQSTCKDK